MKIRAVVLLGAAILHVSTRTIRTHITADLNSIIENSFASMNLLVCLTSSFLLIQRVQEGYVYSERKCTSPIQRIYRVVYC